MPIRAMKGWRGEMGKWGAPQTFDEQIGAVGGCSVPLQQNHPKARCKPAPYDAPGACGCTGASVGKFRRPRWLPAGSWSYLRLLHSCLEVGASCQLPPQLRRNRAPTHGLSLRPGLPPSAATSRQSVLLGLPKQMSRAQGGAAPPLLT